MEGRLKSCLGYSLRLASRLSLDPKVVCSLHEAMYWLTLSRGTNRQTLYLADLLPEKSGPCNVSIQTDDINNSFDGGLPRLVERTTAMQDPTLERLRAHMSDLNDRLVALEGKKPADDHLDKLEAQVQSLSEHMQSQQGQADNLGSQAFEARSMLPGRPPEASQEGYGLQRADDHHEGSLESLRKRHREARMALKQQRRAELERLRGASGV